CARSGLDWYFGVW
nr:immunoglobulin heavy chain junction region [Mus musculus]MBK4188758.1 immunoglobulin heavy chain junction region [Mus musculus]